jgi:hypothetical protein
VIGPAGGGKVVYPAQPEREVDVLLVAEADGAIGAAVSAQRVRRLFCDV